MGGSVRPPSVLRGGVARSGARFSAVSAPSLRTLACTAQLSCCLYGSGSAAIRFETARERRRRHRRSAPARHHWKDTVAFHGCCEMLNTSPRLALPHAATRPPPARAPLTGPYWGCFETFQSSSGARESVCWRLSGHELCRHRTRVFIQAAGNRASVVAKFVHGQAPANTARSAARELEYLQTPPIWSRERGACGGGRVAAWDGLQKTG